VRKKIIAVDFDGVLHRYNSGWQGVAVIPDPPVDGAIEWLVGLLESGYEVHISSSRNVDREGRLAMKAWLVAHGFPVGRLGEIQVPVHKPPAWLTIDDRALTFIGVFPTSEEIEAFRPWHQAE
jgi:hypothetical protein